MLKGEGGKRKFRVIHISTTFTKPLKMAVTFSKKLLIQNGSGISLLKL